MKHRFKRRRSTDPRQMELPFPRTIRMIDEAATFNFYPPRRFGILSGVQS